VIPRPFPISSKPLRSYEIEAMNAAAKEPYPPASTPPWFPDSTWVSLACKAPAVCDQLRRVGS
jgi:hypothetical protein